MTKIVVLAKCKDSVKWEAAFRTHGDLFRTAYGVSKISYGLGEDGYVGACFETGDLAKTTTAISSPETAKTMEYDGLLLDTVRVLVLDKELAV